MSPAQPFSRAGSLIFKELSRHTKSSRTLIFVMRVLSDICLLYDKVALIQNELLGTT